MSVAFWVRGLLLPDAVHLSSGERALAALKDLREVSFANTQDFIVVCKAA